MTPRGSQEGLGLARNPLVGAQHPAPIQRRQALQGADGKVSGVGVRLGEMKGARGDPAPVAKVNLHARPHGAEAGCPLNGA